MRGGLINYASSQADLEPLYVLADGVTGKFAENK